MNFVHFPFLSCNGAIVFSVSKEKSQQKICPNIHGFDAAFLPKISENIVMPIQNHTIKYFSILKISSFIQKSLKCYCLLGKTFLFFIIRKQINISS